MNDDFKLTMSVWEIISRTSIVYLATVVVMRVVPKRRSGTLSPNDLIAIVLIGALSGDAVMGGSHSIADILVMITVIVAWGYLIDAAEFRFPIVHRVLREGERALIRDGRILRRNLCREWVTKDELMSALREQGIEDPSQVRSACLEADGQISVVKMES